MKKETLKLIKGARRKAQIINKIPINKEKIHTSKKAYNRQDNKRIDNDY